MTLEFQNRVDEFKRLPFKKWIHLVLDNNTKNNRYLLGIYPLCPLLVFRVIHKITQQDRTITSLITHLRKRKFKKVTEPTQKG